MIAFWTILHGILAIGLLGATTPPGTDGVAQAAPAERFVDRFRAIPAARFATAVVVLYVLTFALGAAIYPTYVLDVKGAVADYGLRKTIGVFQIKEHVSVMGLSVLPAYWHYWRTLPPGNSIHVRRLLTTFLMLGSWWNLVIGHVLNQCERIAMNRRLYSAPAFSVTFGLGYAIAVAANQPLFRYYPLVAAFRCTTSRRRPSVRAMAWYGWISLAALFAGIVTPLIPKRVGGPYARGSVLDRVDRDVCRSRLSRERLVSFLTVVAQIPVTSVPLSSDTDVYPVQARPGGHIERLAIGAAEREICGAVHAEKCPERLPLRRDNPYPPRSIQ